MEKFLGETLLVSYISLVTRLGRSKEEKSVNSLLFFCTEKFLCSL